MYLRYIRKFFWWFFMNYFISNLPCIQLIEIRSCCKINPGWVSKSVRCILITPKLIHISNLKWKIICYYVLLCIILYFIQSSITVLSNSNFLYQEFRNHPGRNVTSKTVLPSKNSNFLLLTSSVQALPCSFAFQD